LRSLTTPQEVTMGNMVLGVGIEPTLDGF
jgi:hypothetical protein